jgi:hypothetical protein
MPFYCFQYAYVFQFYAIGKGDKLYCMVLFITHYSLFTSYSTADHFKNAGNYPVTEHKIEFIDFRRGKYLLQLPLQ